MILNRRDFLISTSGLLLAPALSQGQLTAPLAANTSEVFADFESGTYEGWTLTGNCWTKEPHHEKTVAGITGFQGKRFLCTLHPTLGTNATGKAVSKEFTIEKPFINFLIGGGNYPGEACLNLVVSGKVVKTETGNDSAKLQPVVWDVGEFLRQKAYFEVVDTSASPERGYVMVDSITFADPDNRAAEISQTPRGRPYLLVPVRFADSMAQTYRTPANLIQFITDPNLGVDRFLRISSGNRVSMSGTQATSVINLPKAREQYLSQGEFNAPGWFSQAKLIADAGPLLEDTHDLKAFYGVILFPNISDDAGGGSGLAPSYRKRGETDQKPFPVIYINPPSVSMTTITHEVGHHFNIGHVRTAVPGVPHNASAMSYAGRPNRQLVYVTCDHIMWYKLGVGWGSASDSVSLSGKTNTVMRLYPRSGSPRGLRLIKVPLAGDGVVLTLEAVLPVGFDEIVPEYGVLAHRIDEKRCLIANLGVWPEEIWPQAIVSGRKKIIFQAGESWADGASGVEFRVEKVTPGYCDVRVLVNGA